MQHTEQQFVLFSAILSADSLLSEPTQLGHDPFDDLEHPSFDAVALDVSRTRCHHAGSPSDPVRLFSGSAPARTSWRTCAASTASRRLRSLASRSAMTKVTTPKMPTMRRSAPITNQP